MKKVMMFHFRGCPYCAAAERWIAELQSAYPELAAVEIQRIDEHVQRALAYRYDYWYVPTFYVDGVKAHEGACSREIVERVLKSALE
jgi:glutaredoxin